MTTTKLARGTAFVAVLVALAGPVVAADQAITLPSPDGALQGTLSLPAGTAGPVPVALIIAGSGPTDRDGNSRLIAGNNDSLKMLAGALADVGIAAVRYDKRGVGSSAGAQVREADLRLDTFARDAADWVRLLAADSRFSGVAVIGHSEGALVGLLAAAQSPVRAYVSIAGIGERMADTLRRQLDGRLPAALAVRHEAILVALEQGRTVADVPAPLLGLYRPSVQPYLISEIRRDPPAEIAALHVPCLIVQGDTDLQVRVADADALKAAKPDAKEIIVPGMNHVLKRVPPDRAQQIASYADPTLPLAPGLVPALARFLAASLPTPSAAVLAR